MRTKSPAPRTGATILALLLFLPLAAYADIEITLKNSFIEKFKNRATIDATFTVDKAHRQANSPKKDGDLHASGRAPEIGLASVAELMNARSARPALDLIHESEQTGEPVSVRGVWRIWCEHGGDSSHVQGKALHPFTTTNPDHVFEIHPLLQVGDEDVESSLQPIEGFTYKEAGQAFRSYENLKSHIKPGTTQTTITTGMAGFNYVEFVIGLNEDPVHVIDDGLTVMASVHDLEGELLVRNRRMVFAEGTVPFERVRALRKGDALHVVGIPRINLSLLSFRVANRNRIAGVLDWSLPYEMVIVAAFDDVPFADDADVAPSPDRAAGGGAPPAPAVRPESEVIEALARLLAERSSGAADTGACTFTANVKVFCAVFTRAQCDQLAGTWHAGTTCSDR